MGNFIERLTLAMGGDSVHAFAQKCHIQDSTFRRYINGSLPNLDNLVTIARTAGVNIDWLATGEGAMRPGDNNYGLLNEPGPGYHAEKRIIPYGRRKTDAPMSSQLRRAMEGLLYLEQEDPDSFIVLMGEIVKNEKKARENENIKKTGNIDA